MGCWHGNYSFPMTLKSGHPGKRWTGGSRRHTYVVCLDCGRELPYDWTRMKVVRTIPNRPSQEPQQGAIASSLCDLSLG